MSQDVKVFSCFKPSYLQSLMVFRCFCEVVVKQYRQGDPFSTTEFLCFRWAFKVVIHRLLTWCANVKNRNIRPNVLHLAFPSFQRSVVFLCSFSYSCLSLYHNSILQVPIKLVDLLTPGRSFMANMGLGAGPAFKYLKTCEV